MKKTLKLLVFLLMLMIAVIFCSKVNNEDGMEEIDTPENKEIIKTFKDELGFIRLSNDADNVIHYYFEPFIINSAFSPLLHFGSDKDSLYAELEKYDNKVVRINGNVTNCLAQIVLYRDIYGGITVERNILEISSIAIAKDMIDYYSFPNCEDRQIIKTFKDELGYIKCGNHPSVDAIFYSFFEPLAQYEEFSKQLFLGFTSGSLDTLNKYCGTLVKVSGNVTNCFIPIDVIDSETDQRFYYVCNILELESIEINN